MKEIHAHEILRMMEGNYYKTKEELRNAIVAHFGSDCLFHTCSAKGLDSEAIVEFLEQKGKFKAANSADGFTMDIDKVCSSY